MTTLGGEPRYTLYPDADHDAWTRTYADPALYAWLLTAAPGIMISVEGDAARIHKTLVEAALPEEP